MIKINALYYIFFIIVISCTHKLYTVENFVGNSYETPLHPVAGISKIYLKKNQQFEFETSSPIKIVSRGKWSYDRLKGEITLITDTNFIKNFGGGIHTLDSGAIDLTNQIIYLKNYNKLYFRDMYYYRK